MTFSSLMLMIFFPESRMWVCLFVQSLVLFSPMFRLPQRARRTQPWTLLAQGRNHNQPFVRYCEGNKSQVHLCGHRCRSFVGCFESSFPLVKCGHCRRYKIFASSGFGSSDQIRSFCGQLYQLFFSLRRQTKEIKWAKSLILGVSTQEKRQSRFRRTLKSSP